VVEAGVLPLDHHYLVMATEAQALITTTLEVILRATTIQSLAHITLMGTTDLRLDFTTGLITTITPMLITVPEHHKLLVSLKMRSVS
jgi:hypothetical protein